jgi:hypothetical protein
MSRRAGGTRLTKGRRRIDSAAPACPGSRRGRLLTVQKLLGVSVLALATIAFDPLQPKASAPEQDLPVINQQVLSTPETRISPATEVVRAPTHIRYPAAGMDQAVLPLSSTEQESGTGSLTPPQTLEAYWLTAYGSPGPGSTNTTYIVGHSSDVLDSAFNNFSSEAEIGDQLTITTADGPQLYQVHAISTENKNTLKDSHIWTKVPGGLVLVSCYTADLWGTNIIIEASPLNAGG